MNKYHLPSSGDAFFPGGMDRTLYDALIVERSDWTCVWADAYYYWCARDSAGNLLSFIEGDVQRGNCKGPRLSV